MSFTWPLALLFLLAVPVLVGGYLWAMRQRRRQAVTYSSLTLLRRALPRRSRWQRHLPVAFLGVGLALLGVAASRPQITSNVPVGQTSVILALDESGSMCSTDIRPNRLYVAQHAALQFVNSEPAGVKMGLVLFSDFAQVAVPPTSNRRTLVKALDSLSAGDSTAIGAAILKSLDAISEINPQVQPVGNAVESGAVNGPVSGAPTATARPGAHAYVPDVIVLLTDGANNAGIDPISAASYAATRRVRVYTIGFGTPKAARLDCSPQQLGGQEGAGFGRGSIASYGGYPGAFAGGTYMEADLPTLQKVSQRTGGATYDAKGASQLTRVFANLPKDITVQEEHHEISDLFAAAGALLALAAIAAAIRWSPYP
jgi:Ca-activated chloride channel homolog